MSTTLLCITERSNISYDLLRYTGHVAFSLSMQTNMESYHIAPGWIM